MWFLFGFEYIFKKSPQGIYRNNDWNLCWQLGKCQEKVREYFFCQTRYNPEMSPIEIIVLPPNCSNVFTFCLKQYQCETKNIHRIMK